MLTELSKMTTADGDTVTLFRTDERFGVAYGDPAPHDFDGHRRRYVFSVEGKSATGWGAVGAGVEWESATGRRGIDPWESDATPVLAPWADADAFSDDFQPITIRGAIYQFGYSWKPAHPYSGQAWRIEHAGLGRANGAMTDAGRSRIHNVLSAARDLFLVLPNVETELVRRSLDSARARQHKISDKALAAMVKLTDRINAL